MMEERKYQWLCQVISAIGSSLELEEVLALAVDVATRASMCNRCFIYLWDKQREMLVVRATTAGQEKYIRALELELDQGYTGWTAKTLKPVLTNYEAAIDDRFFMVPGLEEEKFQSFMTVPIVSPNNDLIGVFTLCTMTPSQFSDRALDFVQKIATLIAGLIEKAMLYEQMKKKVVVLDGLADLSKLLSKDDRVSDILNNLRKIIIEVLRIDECAFLLLNREKTKLSLEQSTWWIDVNEDVQVLLETEWPLDGTVDELPKSLKKLGFKDFVAWTAVPMQGKNLPLGVIICFRKQQLSFIDEDLTLLQTIAHQGALALERARLVSFLSDRNKKQDFFDALFNGKGYSLQFLEEQGKIFGVDLQRANVVVVAEIVQKNDKESHWMRNFCFSLEDEIEKAFAHSIYLSRNGILQAIIPINDYNKIIEKLAFIKKELEQKHNVIISMAAGNACNCEKDYPRGLEEAHEALKVGKVLSWHKSSVVTFNQLGMYRYLYKVWKNDGIVRDRQQELMEKLYDFDKDHATNLLETLEKYLECMGHVNNAADELYVHRNTMRNRLEKISAILDVDVADRQRWFSLYIALQIVKLKGLERLDGIQAI